jgi:hypothetical protein
MGGTTSNERFAYHHLNNALEINFFLILLPFTINGGLRTKVGVEFKERVMEWGSDPCDLEG